jgi:hypothetical protein
LGSSRFTYVDNVVLERREKACLSCPHLTNQQFPTENVVGENQEKSRLGNALCAKEGVRAAVKARLIKESCPDLHSEDKGLTRWGELITNVWG